MGWFRWLFGRKPVTKDRQAEAKLKELQTLMSELSDSLIKDVKEAQKRIQLHENEGGNWRQNWEELVTQLDRIDKRAIRRIAHVIRDFRKVKFFRKKREFVKELLKLADIWKEKPPSTNKALEEIKKYSTPRTLWSSRSLKVFFEEKERKLQNECHQLEEYLQHEGGDEIIEWLERAS